MKLHLDKTCPFDLNFTLCCGQTFRWDKIDEWWYGVVRDKVFKIRQINRELEAENADVDFVKEYLGLKDNLPAIGSQIGKDRYIKEAFRVFKGLRILRQDPWECLISYVCATYKNIAAIKRMLLELSHKFGDEIHFDGRDFSTFPEPERLAKASVGELAECGLGYRAKYVLETAKMVQEKDFDFKLLNRANYDKAKTELLNFPGVGLKVADCVLLFSLRRLEAFPVDVWIKRVIERHYSSHFPKEFMKRIASERSPNKKEYQKLNLFGREYFGKYAGYAQEYLYHYERTNK
jgi:N-glycosylase/DNA lyase